MRKLIEQKIWQVCINILLSFGSPSTDISHWRRSNCASSPLQRRVEKDLFVKVGRSYVLREKAWPWLHFAILASKLRSQICCLTSSSLLSHSETTTSNSKCVSIEQGKVHICIYPEVEAAAQILTSIN